MDILFFHPGLAKNLPDVPFFPTPKLRKVLLEAGLFLRAVQGVQRVAGGYFLEEFDQHIGVVLGGFPGLHNIFSQENVAIRGQSDHVRGDIPGEDGLLVQEC